MKDMLSKNYKVRTGVFLPKIWCIILDGEQEKVVNYVMDTCL